MRRGGNDQRLTSVFTGSDDGRRDWTRRSVREAPIVVCGIARFRTLAEALSCVAALGPGLAKYAAYMPPKTA
jgi:hypothetical protein